MVASHWQTSQVVDLTMGTPHGESWTEDGSVELDDDKDVSGIMTWLTRIATGDANKTAGFVLKVWD